MHLAETYWSIHMGNTIQMFDPNIYNGTNSEAISSIMWNVQMGKDIQLQMRFFSIWRGNIFAIWIPCVCMCSTLSRDLLEQLHTQSIQMAKELHLQIDIFSHFHIIEEMDSGLDPRPSPSVISLFSYFRIFL